MAQPHIYEPQFSPNPQSPTGSMSAPGVYLVSAEPSNEDFSAVVNALSRVTGSSLQAALEAGELIFRYVFHGDHRMLKARGKKCSSFRMLASHPQLGMSPSTLWRAVAIYELSLRFPEVCDYVHTGVGHLSVVLGLSQPDQFELLRQTEMRRWTRRKLQKVVAEIRLARRGAGVLPMSRVVERLAGLELLAQDVAMDRQLPQVNQADAHQALMLLERIRCRCAEVEAKLHHALSSH